MSCGVESPEPEGEMANQFPLDTDEDALKTAAALPEATLSVWFEAVPFTPALKTNALELKVSEPPSPLPPPPTARTTGNDTGLFAIPAAVTWTVPE